MSNEGQGQGFRKDPCLRIHQQRKRAIHGEGGHHKGGLQKARVALQGGKWQMASDVGKNPATVTVYETHFRLKESEGEGSVEPS